MKKDFLCNIINILKKYYKENINELTDFIKSEINQSIDELILSVRVKKIPYEMMIDESVRDGVLEVSFEKEDFDEVESFNQSRLSTLYSEKFNELSLSHWKINFFDSLIGKNIQEILDDDEICDCIAMLYCILGDITQNFYVAEWIMLKGYVYRPKIICDKWELRMRREAHLLYNKAVIERAYNIQTDYVDVEDRNLIKLAQANDDMAFLERARRLMPYNFIGQINLNSIPNGLLKKKESQILEIQRLVYHTLCCAANLGNVYALWILGVHLAYSTNSYEQYIGGKIFQRGAQYKDPYHEYMLGEIYERGLGVEKNIVKSQNWYLKAAKRGHHLAYCRHRILSFENNMKFSDIIRELPLAYSELI